MEKIVYYISQIFIIFFRVKSKRNFEYWGQITSEICILKSLRQGEKLNTCVKAEMKFVYPKFRFSGG